jgi:hypothetical protein
MQEVYSTSWGCDMTASGHARQQKSWPATIMAN